MEPSILPKPVLCHLEECGVSVHQVLEKVVTHGCEELLNCQTFSSSEAELASLRDCILTLTHLVGSFQAKLDLNGCSEQVLDEIIGPCLTILSETTHNVSHFVSALQTLVISLFTTSIKDNVMHLLVNLFGKIISCLSSPNESSMACPKFVFSFLSGVLLGIDLDSLEDDVIGSGVLYQKILELLKLSDSKMFFTLASCVVPRFITTNHTGRVAEVWSLIESAHNQSLSIEHTQSEFVLTLLCCFRDVLIYHDKSSPFSSPFPKAVLACSPILDIRKEHVFWTIIQDGLVSSESFSRKRSMYLLHCVLVSVEESVGELVSENDVFWWACQYTATLKRVWDDLVLLLETMEEKQVHNNYYYSLVIRL